MTGDLERAEKQRAARSGKRRGSRESGEATTGSVAQRRAAREQEDAFLAAIQARIDASRRPSLVPIGEVVREVAAELQRRKGSAEDRAAAYTDGKLEGAILAEQWADSLTIDRCADALDRLEQVHP